MKLVLIEWIDSHSTPNNRWQRMETLKELATPLPCRSVGWLVASSGGMKVIVPHVSGEDDCGAGEIAIPDKAITKMTVLRKT